ncbi:MAG: glutamate--cysteine ligase, partial [Pseudomonadota bacterium]
YRQLNANLLQIENEYYSLVRPKRVAQSGESPTQALRRGGVEYVELRALDVDPFSPAGVSLEQLLVLEAFMLYCLSLDSPPIDDTEAKGIASNTREVARRGREPGLQLYAPDGNQTPLRDEALRLVDGMLAFCEDVFGASGADVRQALGRQRCAIVEPSLTPSSRFLEEMKTRGEGFVHASSRLSQWHRDSLRGRGDLSPAMHAVLEHEVRRSHKRQREVEATDQLSFEQYLHAYYRQTRRR